MNENFYTNSGLYIISYKSRKLKIEIYSLKENLVGIVNSNIPCRHQLVSIDLSEIGKGFNIMIEKE